MTRADRILRLLAWGAFLINVHDALTWWHGRKVDEELRFMVEAAHRP